MAEAFRSAWRRDWFYWLSRDKVCRHPLCHHTETRTSRPVSAFIMAAPISLPEFAEDAASKLTVLIAAVQHTSTDRSLKPHTVLRHYHLDSLEADEWVDDIHSRATARESALQQFSRTPIQMPEPTIDEEDEEDVSDESDPLGLKDSIFKG